MLSRRSFFKVSAAAAALAFALALVLAAARFGGMEVGGGRLLSQRHRVRVNLHNTILREKCIRRSKEREREREIGEGRMMMMMMMISWASRRRGLVKL